MAIGVIAALYERLITVVRWVLRTRATCAKRLFQREPARAQAFHASAHNKGIHPRMKRLAAGLQGTYALRSGACSTLKPTGEGSFVSGYDARGLVLQLPFSPETQAPPALIVSRMLAGPEVYCPLLMRFCKVAFCLFGVWLNRSTKVGDAPCISRVSTHPATPVGEFPKQLVNRVIHRLLTS